MNARYFGISALLVLAALIATLLALPHLPQQVPTHWNVHGRVDAYGPRWTIFLWPGIAGAMLLVFAVLPWLSPKRFEVDAFRATYLY